ncbi:hypothetical protein [Aurantiacibacter zhengii]|nr:hypothetical protein [Aurantiacibacter zhengii]
MLEQGNSGIVCIPLGEGEAPESAAAKYERRTPSTGKQTIVCLTALDLAL